MATYDLQPEMSAPEVTDKLVAAIGSGKYDAIVCNYANADMVGHTGDFDAAIKAIETLDACIRVLVWYPVYRPYRRKRLAFRPASMRDDD